MHELLAAASAALGEVLSEPADLGGSERSAVLRCRRPDGATVVVKSYKRTAAGAESFTAEAAGLAFTSESGTGPRLLAASYQARLVVMSDLGSGPSLADVLLTGPADARGWQGRANRPPALAVPLAAAARRAGARWGAQVDLRACAGSARQNRELAGSGPPAVSRFPLRPRRSRSHSVGVDEDSAWNGGHCSPSPKLL